MFKKYLTVYFSFFFCFREKKTKKLSELKRLLFFFIINYFGFIFCLEEKNIDKHKFDLLL